MVYRALYDLNPTDLASLSPNIPLSDSLLSLFLVFAYLSFLQKVSPGSSKLGQVQSSLLQTAFITFTEAAWKTWTSLKAGIVLFTDTSIAPKWGRVSTHCCHPALLTSMQSTSWETLGWKKHKLESRLPGEISITCISIICRWHHLYGRKWRGTKKPLDESERGEWKSWLKAQHSEN